MTICYEITRSAELTSLSAFRDLVDLACNQLPAIDEPSRYDLKLAVDEACTNIILFGYSGMNPGSIILLIEIETDQARINITDFGRPFEPVELEMPELIDGTAADPETLGLFFIHETTDRIEYESSPAGNRLTMIKQLQTNVQSIQRAHTDS